MTTLSEDVFSTLTAGSPSPLRVYPEVLPPEVTLPAVTYLVIAGEDLIHLQGRASLGRILVRVEVWGYVKLVLEQLMENEIVPLMMSSPLFNVTAINITAADGDFEEDTERYRQSREFTLWRAS